MPVPSDRPRNSQRGAGAPASTRLPGAAASLRVQLSPQELLSERQQSQLPAQPSRQHGRSQNGSMVIAATRNAARQKGGKSAEEMMREWQLSRASMKRTSSNGASTSASGSVGSSDAQLLATSILAQQKRKAIILQRQELLISRNVNTQVLKRALTYLGPSSWIQVLHERHLAASCGYPTCPNKPALPEISQRNSPLPADKPRYRISLRERSIKRNTDDDPGGRNAFCSDECWKRAEWVRRWVLSDDLAASTSKGKAKERDANSFRGEDRTVLESGRFEKRWTEEQWHEIELLEDMDVGQLNILMGEGDEEDEGRSDVGALMGSLLNGHYTKPSASETAAMIDSLVIHERSPGKPPERAGAPAPSPVSHASISHGGSAKPTTKTPSKWTTDAPSLQSPHTQVRGGIGLNDLMGGYVGTSTSSSLVRDIQAISRRGQALANATSKASHGQLQYESDMDGSDDNGVPDEAEQGLDEAKERERAEIARLMDEALGIRDAERDSGVLNGDIGLAELRNEWKWRS